MAGCCSRHDSAARSQVPDGLERMQVGENDMGPRGGSIEAIGEAHNQRHIGKRVLRTESGRKRAGRIGMVEEKHVTFPAFISSTSARTVSARRGRILQRVEPVENGPADIAENVVDQKERGRELRGLRASAQAAPDRAGPRDAAPPVHALGGPRADGGMPLSRSTSAGVKRRHCGEESARLRGQSGEPRSTDRRASAARPRAVNSSLPARDRQPPVGASPGQAKARADPGETDPLRLPPDPVLWRSSRASSTGDSHVPTKSAPNETTVRAAPRS